MAELNVTTEQAEKEIIAAVAERRDELEAIDFGCVIEGDYSVSSETGRSVANFGGDIEIMLNDGEKYYPAVMGGKVFKSCPDEGRATNLTWVFTGSRFKLFWI